MNPVECDHDFPERDGKCVGCGELTPPHFVRCYCCNDLRTTAARLTTAEALIRRWVEFYESDDLRAPATLAESKAWLSKDPQPHGRGA